MKLLLYLSVSLPKQQFPSKTETLRLFNYHLLFFFFINMVRE